MPKAEREQRSTIMTMPTDERDRILSMIEAGQVSASEAAQLLDALGPGPQPSERNRARLVRVRVTDLPSGRQKANVTIPVSLVNVGLRLGARLAPQLSASALADLIRSIERGATGRLLEWQDLEEGERVELFVE
jgi:xanthine/CO dehydrogenase XdhC/CoxF family maturation factor